MFILTHTVPATGADNSFPKDSAARHMTTEVPVATAHETLQQVHERLITRSGKYKTINYIYALDAAGKLEGVLSVKELFSQPLTKTVGEVCMKVPLIYVHPESHQRHAAYMALRHNLKAIPVIDKNHVFLGEITSDVILTILHKEMHEDTLKRAGIRHAGGIHANILTLSLVDSLKHRIPWLIVGLLGGLLVAKIVTLFETTLAKNLVLASFIPLIVYMSDAVRAQMEAYIIRDLALDKSLPFGRYLLRHFMVLATLAFVLSGLLLVSFGVIYGDWNIAFVLGVSLCTAIFSSLATGLIIPYAFERFGMDPADASGPVATIIQDMLSVVIYFGIATVLL